MSLVAEPWGPLGGLPLSDSSISRTAQVTVQVPGRGTLRVTRAELQKIGWSLRATPTHSAIALCLYALHVIAHDFSVCELLAGWPPFPLRLCFSSTLNKFSNPFQKDFAFFPRPSVESCHELFSVHSWYHTYVCICPASCLMPVGKQTSQVGWETLLLLRYKLLSLVLYFLFSAPKAIVSSHFVAGTHLAFSIFV